MDLHSFFNPSSIAIVGVSQETKKVGHLVTKNCIDQGYKGDIFLVNPKYDLLLGKKVYPSLSAIGKPVDLVVLAVPGNIALSLLDEIGSLGIKHVVLYAAGFKETSEEGKLKEELLVQKTKKYGITLLGPNCIGFVNTKNKANVTFLKSPAPEGNIGFVSQSGALGSLMVDYLVSRKKFGFSYFISLGNKTVIDESDVLEFLRDDPNTRVIAMYLEDVKNGERFQKTLREVSLIKPVVILKSGATQEGSAAALSHTGSMMGNDSVYSAVFSQCGAIRAGEFYEFMTLLKMFSYNKIPLSRDILILSNAGGIGVLLTDELIRKQLRLVTIPDYMRKEIVAAMGSDRISVHNPIDLLGDASAFDYKNAIAATIEKEKTVGAVVILLTPQANTEISETTQVIIEAQKSCTKPIYPVFMGEVSVGNAHLQFENELIASFSSYDHIPGTLQKMCEYTEWKERQRPGNDLKRIPGSGKHTTLSMPTNKILLNLEESMQLLHDIGIQSIPIYLIKEKKQLAQAAEKVGFPLVAKIASDTITHKTDVQGIVTNILTEQELYLAWDKLTSIQGVNGMYVQQMKKGYELIVGAKRDSIFGPVMLMGFGGIYAELFKETVSFVHPVSYDEFFNRLKQSKLYTLLNGFRGSKPVEFKDLYTILNTIGSLFEKEDRITEMDINPLMICDGKPFAIDGRVILKKT